MKRFNIDLEAADASSYKDGMTEVFVKVTVREPSELNAEFSSLHMSEATMRRLHKMLGNHIRNLDEYRENT
ncbi:hypothetical protein M2375_000910 [Comamonas sp. BIGb0152]|uniref:hypothetical protein n=1 Tax=Comamonas sp. BIGb0152 TaxID=2940601 RepID=UPI002169D87D|nr:hypothetical protein [Comamonas sp. BIGb0152]MCS4292704.1 hypothetical protein [Comamonas sp. BIGb0152]